MMHEYDSDDPIEIENTIRVGSYNMLAWRYNTPHWIKERAVGETREEFEHRCNEQCFQIIQWATEALKESGVKLVVLGLQEVEPRLISKLEKALRDKQDAKHFEFRLHFVPQDDHYWCFPQYRPQEHDQNVNAGVAVCALVAKDSGLLYDIQKYKYELGTGNNACVMQIGFSSGVFVRFVSAHLAAFRRGEQQEQTNWQIESTKLDNLMQTEPTVLTADYNNDGFPKCSSFERDEEAEDRIGTYMLSNSDCPPSTANDLIAWNVTGRYPSNSHCPALTSIWPTYPPNATERYELSDHVPIQRDLRGVPMFEHELSGARPTRPRPLQPSSDRSCVLL